MNQIVKDKMQRLIMVVKNNILFKDVKRENKFYLPKEYDFQNVILNNYEWMKRVIAEQNYDYKQPIPYWILISQDDKIFVYKRWWKNSNAWEKRLHNRVSIWVWGHIEKKDIEDLNPKFNIIENVLLREINEETNLGIEDIDWIKLVWYINNDVDDVWKVHFGLVYLVKVKNPQKVKLMDWEIDKGWFFSIEEIKKIFNDENNIVEEWSKLAFERIREIY